MFTISEELFLLTLRDKRNSVAISYSKSLPYALSGAMMIELMAAGVIDLIDEKKVVIKPEQPAPQNERLSKLVQIMRASAKPRKISHWIMVMAAKGKKIEKVLMADLIGRGVLKEENSLINWFIPYVENTSLNASAKYACKQRLREMILCGSEPDQQSAALLSLITAFGLLENIFTPDEIRMASDRVESLLADATVSVAFIKDISNAAVSAAKSANDLK